MGGARAAPQPIKQAGYISATSASPHDLASERQPVHTGVNLRSCCTSQPCPVWHHRRLLLAECASAADGHAGTERCNISPGRFDMPMDWRAPAEPNSLVASDATLRLVPGLFESVDLGPCDVKGFAKPVRAWRIAGEAADVESRFHALYRAAGTPLAGRTEELGLLMQRWQRANKGEGPDPDC